MPKSKPDIPYDTIAADGTQPAADTAVAAVAGAAPRRVLIARFSAFGDVAMTVPVIYSACRCYPATTFVLATRRSMAGIFVNKPSNLIIEGLDMAMHKGVRGLWRMTAAIVKRHGGFDAFLDLHGVLRTRVMALYCRLHGIRVSSINKGRSHRRALTRRNNKVMLPLLSQRSRYREVFFNARLPLTWRFDGLYGRGGKAPAADYAAITPPKGLGEQWIGIAPFAAHKGKIYPPELMRKVVEKLCARPDTRVFLLGAGGAEQQQLDEWAAALPTATSLAGKHYGFAAELALMSHFDCALTMDSANMHLAAIAGAKVVSIWGATHPYCGFKAWRQNETNLIGVPLACRPCSVFGDKPCYRGDYICLRAIRPDVVYNKIIENLNHNNATDK
ncbi:MAG: glycosyltransferase family 9 protein [Muribaculaceae bacterium]